MFQGEHSKETESVCDMSTWPGLAPRGACPLVLWVLGMDYISWDPVGKNGLMALVAVDIICVKPELYGGGE